MRVILSIVSFAVSAGCSAVSTREGPSCEEAVQNVGRLYPAGPAHDELDPERMRSTCEARHWSRELRECLVGARSETEHAECARMERVRRGDDLGGPSCDLVVAHQRAVLDAGRADATLEAHRMAWCRARSRAWKACVLAIASEAGAATAIAAYARCSEAELGMGSE